MTHSMGESKQGCLRADSDRRPKLEFHGSKVTSDAGLLAYSELDDAIKLTEMAGEIFADSRIGKNGRHLPARWALRDGAIGHQRELCRVDRLSGAWVDKVHDRRRRR